MRPGKKSLLIKRLLLAMTIAAVFLVGPSQPAEAAFQIDIHGPAGSGEFGTTVTVLPNGNLVITDPYYDSAEALDVGAFYLYDGASGEQISMLIGTADNDLVDSWRVTVLSDGNYLVRRPYWDNGAAVDVGAIYLYDGASGTQISMLSGTTANDQVSSGGVIVLSNNNYLVKSYHWNNEGAADAGAVTWWDGSSGVTEEVSEGNSLVGSTAGDQVGSGGVTLLSNGNYVVSSPKWDNGAATDAGAVTWVDGNNGISGEITSLNSLLGSTTGDQVGYITALSNGDYLVSTPRWDNATAIDTGAVTWGNGTSGVSGEVSALNSLVGSTTGDQVGYDGNDNSVVLLSNDNYVMTSPFWDNGAAVDAGAVTWANANSGLSGEVSALNSLVGSTAGDRIGFAYYYKYVIPLSNGNYVVSSPNWDNGSMADVGAVTWADGTSGITGPISIDNSLIGSNENDMVGCLRFFDITCYRRGVTDLSNGNYIVSSPYWDNAAEVDAGAATWGDGASGISGVVSNLNSLVGNTTDDNVGSGGVIALTNGNYVVNSPFRKSDASEIAGAITWGNGTSGISGSISAANSLLSSGSVIPISNGNYLVLDSSWNNHAGAVTWGDGTSGVTGEVSALNSLVGDSAGDNVGSAGNSNSVTLLSNGNYVVISTFWNQTQADPGAVTWGNGTSGVSGVVSPLNSLVGIAFGFDKGGHIIGGVTPLSNGNYVVSNGFWVTWGDGNFGVSGVASTANSLVGSDVTTLSNGSYVVINSYWDNGTVTDVGAITWGDGNSGITGEATPLNSLVGNLHDDGKDLTVHELSNGDYVVKSPSLDQTPVVVNVGGITWGSGDSGITGPITAVNSVIGTAAYGGFEMKFQFDSVNNQLVVGRPADNIVTLFKKVGNPQLFLPLVVK